MNFSDRNSPKCLIYELSCESHQYIILSENCLFLMAYFSELLISIMIRFYNELCYELQAAFISSHTFKMALVFWNWLILSAIINQKTWRFSELMRNTEAYYDSLEPQCVSVNLFTVIISNFSVSLTFVISTSTSPDNVFRQHYMETPTRLYLLGCKGRFITAYTKHQYAFWGITML